MKQILLCVNLDKDPQLRYTRRVLELLEARQAQARAFLPFGTPPADFPQAWLCKDPEAAITRAELLLCLGGDGTMLHSSQLAARSGVPMLGINLGHMGFITELEREDLNRLDEVLAGQYAVEQRMMLDYAVERNGETVCSGFGLNEALITRQDPGHSLHLSAYGDERKISDYAGDGIIVATPTGSTAYSMAAGGPIVEPTAENLLLTPLCAQSLAAKPYVLAGERRIGVRLLRGTEDRALLLVDGEHCCTLRTGDLVVVRRSAYRTRLLKLRHLSFYDIVKHKLN